MTFTKPTKDFAYRRPPFQNEVPIEPRTPAAREWAKSVRAHRGSGTLMFTLRPIPGKGSKRLDRFTTRVEKAFTGLRIYGYVTTGPPTGASLCEAHVGLHRDDVATMLSGALVPFERKLRRAFDVVVTGPYVTGEVAPADSKLKHERPHKNVIAYISNHREHREANVLWTLPPVGRKRKRRKARKRQVVAGFKKLFPVKRTAGFEEEFGS